MPLEKARNHKLKAVPRPGDTPVGEGTTIDECPKCFGTGMELVPGKGARICTCRKVRSRDLQFSSVRLPRRYDGFHFGNYKPQNPSQKAAQNLALTLNHEYPAVDQGLLFMGSVGVGKTHLAVSILKGLTERGFRCLFYDFASLLKEKQDS